MNEPTTVLILCRDLFFGSQLQAAVQRGGGTPRTCLSQNGCLAQLSEKTASWIVVDLELPGLDLAELRSAAGERCRLIAFGPHVRGDLFDAARGAGVDLLFTRGQAAQSLEQVLREANSAE